MDIFSTGVEVPETSFEFSHQNQAKVIISFGPKNGFLWRGEPLNEKMHLVESLSKVFTEGFTQRNEESVLASLPYIQQHHPDFICASNTYCNGDEFTGLDHEESSAGMYGYIYLIDTSQKNIQSIPLCEENLLNPNFVAGYIGEQISEGPDYAIISKVDSNCIIGAMPSSKEVACALGIEEKSFIKNPAFKKIFNCEKIKQVIGEEFSLIVFERLHINPNPPLPLNEVYQRYKQAEESNNQQAASSLGASSSQNRSSVIFFRDNIVKPSFQEAYKSPHP